MPIRVDEDVRAQVQALRESHATINEGLADVFENVGRARRGVNQYLEPFARTILRRYAVNGLTEKEVLSNALAVYDTSQSGEVSDDDDDSAPRVPDDDEEATGPLCQHCGKRASVKRTVVCRICLKNGHVNLPADCDACNKGIAI